VQIIKIVFLARMLSSRTSGGLMEVEASLETARSVPADVPDVIPLTCTSNEVTTKRSL